MCCTIHWDWNTFSTSIDVRQEWIWTAVFWIFWHSFHSLETNMSRTRAAKIMDHKFNCKNHWIKWELFWSHSDCSVSISLWLMIQQSNSVVDVDHPWQLRINRLTLSALCSPYRCCLANCTACSTSVPQGEDSDRWTILPVIRLESRWRFPSFRHELARQTVSVTGRNRSCAFLWSCVLSVALCSIPLSSSGTNIVLRRR